VTWVQLCKKIVDDVVYLPSHFGCVTKIFLDLLIPIWGFAEKTNGSMKKINFGLTSLEMQKTNFDYLEIELIFL